MLNGQTMRLSALAQKEKKKLFFSDQSEVSKDPTRRGKQNECYSFFFLCERAFRVSLINTRRNNAAFVLVFRGGGTRRKGFKAANLFSDLARDIFRSFGTRWHSATPNFARDSKNAAAWHTRMRCRSLD